MYVLGVPTLSLYCFVVELLPWNFDIGKFQVVILVLNMMSLFTVISIVCNKNLFQTVLLQRRAFDFRKR